MIRKLLWFLLTLALPVRSEESFLPDTSNFRAWATRIPMRDGKSLAADVYVPKSGRKSPTVLVQTPYDRKNMRRHWTGGIDDGPSPLFTDTNYTFVVTDWRGRYESKDAQTGPANLSNDGFDTVAWIVAQDWSSGKVGTWGPSALGRVQYMTAKAHPPGLVCAVPIVMPLNLSYDIYFPSGVLWDEFAGMLTRLGFFPNLRGQLAQHPLQDAYWNALPAAREIQPEQFEIPMLFIGGWYDIYADGVIAAFQAVHAKGGARAREHSKLIVGPWIHAGDVAHTGDLDFPAADHYGLRQAHAFFDGWLRGQTNDFDKRAAITYYQMGADAWRTTDAWPPHGGREQELYLSADRSLQAAKPKAGAEPPGFTFDPAHPAPTIGGHVLTPELRSGPRDQREKVESRSDVLVFTGAALDKPLEIAGKVRARLWVSSDCKDTDVVLLLTDVYPDGRSMLVGEGIRRMRLRSSAAREELITPGEIYPVTIELDETALTFQPGHRVRAIVTSSDYPKYAVNWNDGGPMYGEGPGVKAANRVYMDAAHPSAIVLPVRYGGYVSQPCAFLLAPALHAAESSTPVDIRYNCHWPSAFSLRMLCVSASLR
jgi:predicted acyl esterase